jgi:peroxiredoxin (alkyl hydroperoxide reductase subunit C)
MAVLVGKKAPSFSADAVVNGGEFVEGFSLDQYVGKKYVLFFFYPADFTFVCPTEILAFQDRIEEFESRDVAVVGCSVDAKNVHWAWLQTEQKDGGIKGVKYPLVADASMTIAENYDVMAGEWDYNDEGEAVYSGVPEAYRGLFLIDRDGIVRHQLVNDMPLGRSVDEALRLIDALQYSEEHGEVCPANWRKGDRALKENHDSIAAYLGDK